MLEVAVFTAVKRLRRVVLWPPTVISPSLVAYWACKGESILRSAKETRREKLLELDPEGKRWEGPER